MGTSVRACPTLTSALAYIAATLKNPWAGSWIIHGPNGVTIAESPEGVSVVSAPDHDEEHHETAAPIALHPATLRHH